MPKSVYSPGYDQFRALLVEARKAAGLNQAEVAAQLNRPQSYISKYENGERRLDVIEFLDIARILAIDVPAFLQELQNTLPSTQAKSSSTSIPQK